MGDQSHSKETTVSGEGISVHQLYTEEEFDVPSVVLRIVSERDEPAEMRLTVPEIDARKVGFHPEFESDSWSINDEMLTFESEIGPEEELTTIYAVETEEPEVCHQAISCVRLAVSRSTSSRSIISLRWLRTPRIKLSSPPVI